MLTIDFVAGRVRGELRLAPGEIRLLEREIGHALRLREPETVSCAYINEETMQKLNKQFRGKDAPTDVLAFAYPDEEVIGEVLVCPAVARRQALHVNRTAKQEAKELIVHGVLHVFGFDHIHPKDERVMLSLQKKILDRL
ncbi:MAG: putative rRNA maturation factor [Candidatus Giovannonibacteria bacterium GW2011_GWA2_53_7]|uniref:Endoribonuclease YbeY n=1 Tax=Candidatus Giovannonibacteria bacterium GW2011_GWA2_53_7 TaxID=1618650 RepID=A0A0G2ANY4_9BACT|nr:MAG: putative rRNA maturation factor [Candidatus Giovannonibacteria bacterium GW2011_GWA2_53_7]